MTGKRFKIYNKETWDTYIEDTQDCYSNGNTKKYWFGENEDFCDLFKKLNELSDENKELKEEIARQKYTKHIMRENIKSYERAIKHLRKSYNEFDEMRLDRIRFLEKKLKKNGLNIYVNDCGDLEE